MLFMRYICLDIALFCIIGIFHFDDTLCIRMQLYHLISIVHQYSMLLTRYIYALISHYFHSIGIFHDVEALHMS